MAEWWQKQKMKELLVPRGPQCIIVWGKFTSTYRRSWTLRIHQSKSWARQKTNILIWDYSCHLQRQQLFILDRKMLRTTECSWTCMWKKSSICSALFRNWCWKILTRLLGFSQSSWISRSGGEMERIADGNVDNSFWTFFLRNRWRANFVRMEYSPKTYVIGIASRVSGRRKAQKHWSWKIWRSNHLHVNVQRHRWEPHESLILLEFMNQCFFPSSLQSQIRLYGK